MSVSCIAKLSLCVAVGGAVACGGSGPGSQGAGGGASGSPAGAAGLPGSSGTAPVGGGGQATAGGVGGAGGASTGGGALGGGGSGGGVPSAGTGGTMTQMADCSFTATSMPSSAIPTVSIIEWSTTLPKVESAQIEYTLVDPMPDELNRGGIAPVDLKNPKYRTLLLGLKGQRDYTYSITATGGGASCSSMKFPFKTGAVASGIPAITHKVENAAARSRGFIVTSGGLSGFGGGGGGGGGGGAMLPAIIIDTDGAVVWWAPAPGSCSRAHMNWEGTDMWMQELNVDNAGGEMRRVSMDGLDTQKDVMGLAGSHHDFTVLPGGVVATMVWATNGRDPASDLVERSPDGTVKVVRKLDATAYASSSFHANAIHYRMKDDTYTVSDRNPNLFIKLKRSGELLWQFGGSCANSPAPKCAAGTWQVNHGHHLLDNGHFLFFNNGMGGQSAAFEYELSESGTGLMATQVWKYQPSGVNSDVLGDVERLPNGNTLVTYSTVGTIHEIDASRNLVQSFKTNTVGYADFRESLYGPPPR